MFDSGFGEWILIGALLLILVKPEDLPALVRNIGRAYGKFRQIYYSITDELLHYDMMNQQETRTNTESVPKED